jgi:hypothetical protein
MAAPDHSGIGESKDPSAMTTGRSSGPIDIRAETIPVALVVTSGYPEFLKTSNIPRFSTSTLASNQAEMLIVIGDHERHLGFGGPWVAVIPAYGDQLTVMFHDHGQSGDIVHFREVDNLLRGQLGMKVEVPPIHGRRREQSVEIGEL